MENKTESDAKYEYNGLTVKKYIEIGLAILIVIGVARAIYRYLKKKKTKSSNKLSFAMISFGLNIFKIYLVWIRLVEIWSEYCICCVLICELEIHKTIILKRNGFSHGSGTDTFLRFLPNHSIDHHK